VKHFRSWKVRAALLVAIAAVGVGGAVVAVSAGDTGTKVYRGGATADNPGTELTVGSFVAQWEKQPDGSCRNTQGKAGGITAADEPGAGGSVQLHVDSNCRVTVGEIVTYGANPPNPSPPAGGEVTGRQGSDVPTSTP
jgi:hypothetical protein